MKKLKMMLLNFVLKYLFNGVCEHDFLRIQVQGSTGRIFEGKQELPTDFVKELASQARSVQKYAILQKLFDSLKKESAERMVNKSKLVEDMIFNKATLYTIDMLEKKLNLIACLYK